MSAETVVVSVIFFFAQDLGHTFGRNDFAYQDVYIFFFQETIYVNSFPNFISRRKSKVKLSEIPIALLENVDHPQTIWKVIT